MAEYTEFTATVPTWTKSYTFLGDTQLATVTPNGTGGEYTDKGKALGFIKADGSLNQAAMTAKGQSAGAKFAELKIYNTQDWLKKWGVRW